MLNYQVPDAIKQLEKSQCPGSESAQKVFYGDSFIDLARLLSQLNNFNEVVHLIAAFAKEQYHAENSRILIINPRTRQTVKTINSIQNEGDDKGFHLLHTNICGWVIKNEQSFLSSDVQSDTRFKKNLFKSISVKSAMCVPLKAEGILFGSILLSNLKNPDIFTINDLACLEEFVVMIAPYLHNVQKVQPYFSRHIPETSLIKKYKSLGLLGESKKFIGLLKSIEAAIQCDVRVILEGQSGTGKELIVKAIHHFSSRADKKFIAIDCGAIPGNLIESELFGHVKGAFTGANTARKGLLEEANGGTLFMDEISNLHMDMQAKLLRLLQEGEIRPLGSNEIRKVDVRIISASSSSLAELVRNNKFREDLFYRLHVFPIEVPSLDDRREDIPLLANHFLEKFAREQNKLIESFHEEIMDFLRQRHWSGNIRELENLVERFVTLTPRNVKSIDPTILPAEYRKEWDLLHGTGSLNSANKPLDESIMELEEQLIRRSLAEHRWNQSRAARSLSISEQTIRYKMGKLGIVKTSLNFSEYKTIKNNNRKNLVKFHEKN